MNAGGSLYIEGADVATPAHSSLLEYLGVSLFTTGTASGVERVVGEEGTLGNGYDLEYSYGTMADYKVDMLKENGATTYLRCQDGWSRGAYYEGNEGTYRTITSSPFLGAMKDGDGINTKANLMATYLDYLLNEESNLSVPENVQVDAETGLVTWDEPSFPSEWLAWCSDNNFEGVGQSGVPATFSAASRWMKADLEPYDGQQLARIRIFPLGPTSTYRLKVWTGYLAETEILSRPLDNLKIGEWNEIDILDANITISSAAELWFGYEVDCSADEIAAGYDEGPGVAGKGDVFTVFGEWDYLGNYDVSANFNIKGLALDTSGRAVAMEASATPAPAEDLAQFGKGGHSDNLLFERSDNVDSETSGRGLTGYNVYLDDVLVAENIAGNEYQLEGLVSGQSYTVGVSAVYAEGESDIVEVVFYSVAADDDVAAAALLTGNYPNPFNPETSIYFNLAEKQNVDLAIYNIKGQKVKTLIADSVFESGLHTVNWNGTDDSGRAVSSGIYFYKMQAGNLVSSKKMILMK